MCHPLVTRFVETVSLEGTTLEGKYELVRIIGRGGMGEVYEAQHVGVERTVAVKLLKKELASKKRARARFHREARAAGRIGHDNVCEVTDLGVADDGTPFYVMPLLEGETLSALLAREGQLPIERAADIATQLLGALSAAHSKGVVHRDLKPENVFLTTLGGRPDFVKILDFGITKFGVGVDEDGEEATLTETGAVMGTPHYMAPEQAKGSREVDGRVDIYAVGLILYRMLTGERPIDGDSHNEILWNIWNAPIKPPRALRPGLSSSIETVVIKAMARHRDERYATAELFSQDLNEALEGSLTSSRSSGPTLPTTPDESNRPSQNRVSSPSSPTDETSSLEGAEREVTADRGDRRGRWGLISLALGIVLLSAIIGVVLWPRGQDQADDPSTASRHRSSVTNVSAAQPSVVETTDFATPNDAASDGGLDAPTMVTITLTDLPSGATATVDGRRIVLPAFEAPLSENPIEIVLVAPGYRETRIQVPVVENIAIPASLEPLRAHRAKGPMVAPGARQDNARQKAPVRSFGEMP